jgi:CheY-like chemotaxis protein
VRADAAALEHALLNLVLNAQAAMPNGGSLTLACRRAHLDRSDCEPLFGDLTPGPCVILSVEDTGIGMSREVREHMFDPFFTTKALGEGTGLGLSAVHGTMRSHHGAIAVHSHPGLGTRIELFLPALPASATESVPERSEGAVPARLKAHVLLVDDEALTRSAIGALLQSAGCEVQAVADGMSLIDALRSGAHPDVIVTDLAMPGLSGVRLVQSIEALRPDCPLLLITGYTGDDVAAALPARSGRLLLRKPFGRTELMRSLAELLTTGQTQRFTALAARGA